MYWNRILYDLKKKLLKLNSKHIIYLVFILFFSCKKDKTPPPISQVDPQELVEIPGILNEISGLIFQTDTSLFAHNDSGNEPFIYELSLNEKRVNRSIKIFNMVNLDWEDIAQDQQYIYIADTGNNLGGRKNLKILKILKNEVLAQDSVEADSITFAYEDQTDFTLSNDHNFDCEAMINFENQLFLFSKNRVDFKTNIYSLPKAIGNYNAVLKGEFDVEGLITGATINESKDVIALLGYEDNGTTFKPFIWLFYEFEGNDFFNGKKKKLELNFDGQMEAITFGKNDNLYFSLESESGNEVQFVYHIKIEEFLN